MIEKAKVISQKQSVAKKGMYITTLLDARGELRAYTNRILKEGEEVVISLQQGAANDPLSVTILNKRQAADWLSSHKQPETSLAKVDDNFPEVSFDAIRKLIETALKDFIEVWDDISTNSFCGWFLADKATDRTTLAKAIYKEARNLSYIIEGGATPVIYSQQVNSPKIEVRMNVVSNDELEPRVLITLYEVL